MPLNPTLPACGQSGARAFPLALARLLGGIFRPLLLEEKEKYPVRVYNPIIQPLYRLTAYDYTGILQVTLPAAALPPVAKQVRSLRTARVTYP